MKNMIRTFLLPISRLARSQRNRLFCLAIIFLPFLQQNILLLARHLLQQQAISSFIGLFLIWVFLFSNLYFQALLFLTKKKAVLPNWKAQGLLFLNGLLTSPIWAITSYRMFLSYYSLPADFLSLIFARRWQILPLVGLGYLLICWLLVRFSLTTLFVASDHSVKSSLKKSWQQTTHLFFTVIKQLVLFVLMLTILAVSTYFIYQFCANHVSQPFWVYSLMIGYQLILNVLWALTLLFFALISIQKMPVVMPTNTTTTRKAASWKIGLLLLTVIYLVSLQQQMRTVFIKQPTTAALTISHRGVNRQNGVQNTLQSLTRTSQTAKPALIEMDIQETADHKLVVIHDENLKKLAGINRQVDQMTWAQLKKVTLHEHGHQAQLSLFSTYLNQANRLKQSLLIELKVTDKTKQTIEPLFAAEFSKKQLQRHQLQSMDLATTEALKKDYPRLKVGYILPFDLLGFPKTQADFINIERHTASKDLIDSLHRQHKTVYLWSITKPEQTAYFNTQRVAGLLTDDLTTLHPTTPDLSQRIQFYFEP